MTPNPFYGKFYFDLKIRFESITYVVGTLKIVPWVKLDYVLDELITNRFEHQAKELNIILDYYDED